MAPHPASWVRSLLLATLFTWTTLDLTFGSNFRLLTHRALPPRLVARSAIPSPLPLPGKKPPSPPKPPSPAQAAKNEKKAEANAAKAAAKTAKQQAKAAADAAKTARKNEANAAKAQANADKKTMAEINKAAKQNFKMKKDSDSSSTLSHLDKNSEAAVAARAADKSYMGAKDQYNASEKAIQDNVKKLNGMKNGAEKEKLMAQVKQQEQGHIGDRQAVENGWKKKGSADAAASQIVLDDAKKKLGAAKGAKNKKAEKEAQKAYDSANAWNKDNQCRSRGEQKCCGTIWCKAGQGLKKVGKQIGHVAAMVGEYALKGIGTLASFIPVIGAPIAAAANIGSKGLEGVAKATDNSPGSFGQKMGRWAKDQGIHGGFAATALSVVPGGGALGTAVSAASKAASGAQAATGKS